MVDNEQNRNAMVLGRPEESGAVLRNLARRERSALLALVAVGLLFIIGALASGISQPQLSVNQSITPRLATQVPSNPTDPMAQRQPPIQGQAWFHTVHPVWN